MQEKFLKLKTVELEMERNEKYKNLPSTKTESIIRFEEEFANVEA
jgi:hypothetical protein